MRLTVLLLAAALATTACGGTDDTTTPSTTAPPAPRWTTVTGLPQDRLTTVEGGAGWDKGFVLAGSHTVPAAPNDRGRVNDIVTDIHTSPDGKTWAPATLDDITNSAHQTPVAGYRDAVYVLGATPTGAAVWRSHDGTTWSKTPLPRSKPGEALTAVAAGPRGIVAVGFGRPLAVLDNDDIDNRDHDSLRVWHSTDGTTFTGPTKIKAPGLYNGYLPDVTARPDGFTIFGVNKNTPDPILFSSTDGTDWTADDPRSLTGRPAALTHTDDLTVTFTDRTTTDDDDRRPTVWRRTTGDWTASHDISVGKLPDTNVDTPDHQYIRHVTNWHGWFIATGTSGSAGGVWLSRDAEHWERVPVKENALDTTGSLRVLTNDSTVVLAGDGPKLWTSA